MSTSENDLSDEHVLEHARDRAQSLSNAVGGDLDALRAAASDAAYAQGASLCEEVADATRQLMAQLDADLKQSHSQSSNQSPRP